jgi:hypothetical protein
MRSVKSSVKGWRTAGTRLAVLIVIVVQALGLGAVWPQEPAQPWIEEIAKQEKIYRSRGADVPSGYVTGRGLSDYAGLLPAGFCEALGRMGSSDRWLDIGAGDGQAILDYCAPENDATLAEKCVPYGAKARAVAMSKRIAGRTSGDSRPRASALTVYGISPASACATIRARSWDNSRSLPTCTAASPIPKTCPGSRRER